MAWRPSHCLKEGMLDNTVPGKVTGWMRFAGMRGRVKFDLRGDFHRDIRGAVLVIPPRAAASKRGERDGAPYMQDFSESQTGNVGDITAGLPPHDYVEYPYIEWYSDENGRCVIELDPGDIRVQGKPIPWQESDPVSRAQQSHNMAEFLRGMQVASGVLAIGVGGDGIMSGSDAPNPN